MECDDSELLIIMSKFQKMFSNSSNVFNSRAVYETVKYRRCYLNDSEFPVAYFIKTVKKKTSRQKVK